MKHMQCTILFLKGISNMRWDVHGNKLNLRTLMNPLHTTDNLSYDITYKKAKKKQTKNKKIRDTQMKYDLETFFLQLTIYLMISLTGKQTDTNKILY